MSTVAETIRTCARRGDRLAPPSPEFWFRKAIALASSNPRAAQEKGVAYLLGYAWYMLPDRSPERSLNAERFFRMAVAADRNDLYARLYLGHTLFDEGDYRGALAAFRAIPENGFARYRQEWRDVKLSELILCCRIRLGHVRKIEPALTSFVEHVAAFTGEPFELPRTIELANAIRAVVDGQQRDV